MQSLHGGGGGGGERGQGEDAPRIPTDSRLGVHENLVLFTQPCTIFPGLQSQISVQNPKQVRALRELMEKGDRSKPWMLVNIKDIDKKNTEEFQDNASVQRSKLGDFIFGTLLLIKNATTSSEDQLDLIVQGLSRVCMLEVQREQGVGGGGDTGGKEGAKRTEKGRERAGEGEQGVSDQPFFRVTVQRVPDAECIAAAQDEATKLLGTRPREIARVAALAGVVGEETAWEAIEAQAWVKNGNMRYWDDVNSNQLAYEEESAEMQARLDEIRGLHEQLREKIDLLASIDAKKQNAPGAELEKTLERVEAHEAELNNIVKAGVLMRKLKAKADAKYASFAGVCPVPSGEIKAAVAEVHEKTLAAMKRVVAELDEKKVDVWLLLPACQPDKLPPLHPVWEPSKEEEQLGIQELEWRVWEAVDSMLQATSLIYTPVSQTPVSQTPVSDPAAPTPTAPTASRFPYTTVFPVSSQLLRLLPPPPPAGWNESFSFAHLAAERDIYTLASEFGERGSLRRTGKATYALCALISTVSFIGDPSEGILERQGIRHRLQMALCWANSVEASIKSADYRHSGGGRLPKHGEQGRK